MKVKLHIDTKGFLAKPSNQEWQQIKLRLQSKNQIVNVNIDDIADKIGKGYTISPAVMTGTKAADWFEQQIFMVDIDNKDLPILNVKQAIEIAKQANLPVAFYYYTFSHNDEKPKYRLTFIMDKPVTDPSKRKIIIDTLISLFPQADKACNNSDRVFLGTNKEVVIYNQNARISMDNILAAYKPPKAKNRSPTRNKLTGKCDKELDMLIRDFDLLNYLHERNGEYVLSDNNRADFINCEICGSHHNLRYYLDTNTFYCFSDKGEVGGDIIKYISITEELTMKESEKKFKYELCGGDWQIPIPLEKSQLPDFPIEALPSPVREYVNAVSESTETAVDMAAVSALALVSSAVQGKYEIEGKPDYLEPLNLYVLLIAKSGERKSAIVRSMSTIIHQFENEENKRRQPKIDRQKEELGTLKVQIDQLKKEKKFEEAKKMGIKYRELERKMTKFLRLTADDVTPEALTSLLADNNGVLTILSTEGGFFDILAGRFSNSNMVSIDTVLKAHCGDPIKVDRKGREKESIQRPALTMLLSAQENVLDGLLNNEAFQSRGLIARILFSRPTSKVGSRKFDTPQIPVEIEMRYNDLMTNLLSIEFNNAILVIKLENDAYQLLEKFFYWFEHKLADDFEIMEGWGGKFIGATLRIAGILHCIKNCKSPSKTKVTKQTMSEAITIANYFLKHAKYTFSLMGADKAVQGAKYILKKLKNQSSKEFTKYEIFRLCRNRTFQKTDDIIPSLDILLEYGYLKMRTDKSPTGGRPNGIIYLLNPLYFKD